MDTITQFRNELKAEAEITRRFLDRFDESKADWKPHEKSFTLSKLASHIAEVPSWVPPTMDMEEMVMDMEKYKSPDCKTKKELKELFEKNLKMAEESLEKATEEDLEPTWTMKDTEGNIFFSMPRREVIRMMILDQTIHHRAQLGVYFRLLGIPVPKSYGPSADEQ